jgi:hypothetical protein
LSSAQITPIEKASKRIIVSRLIDGWMLARLVVLSSIFTSACTTPIPAARTPARCQQWNVAGTWLINQSNGFLVTFIVQQNQNELTGSADNGSGPVPFVGAMRADRLTMTVSWAWGGAGHYTATMSPSGLLTEGFTQNLSMPASTANWNTAQQFKCAVRSR